MYRTLAHRRYDVMSQELGIRNIKDRFFYGMCQIFLFFFFLYCGIYFLLLQKYTSYQVFNLATVNSTAIVMFKLAQKIKMIVQCYIFCQQLRLCVVQREIPIENTSEVIIRCLIDHLGEDANALIKHFKVGAVNHFQAF